MKIAIIAQEGSIHVERWISYCLRLGYEVFHLKRKREDTIPGLEEILLPQPCPRFSGSEITEELDILKDVPAILFKDKHAYAGRLKTYRDILKEIRPDVVHAHWLYQYGLHGVLAARGIAPFVQSVWGSDVFIIPMFMPENFSLLQYVLTNAHMVLGNSRTLIETAVGFLDLNRDLRTPGPQTFLFKWGINPVFDPALYDKEKLRQRYGFSRDDVIILSARGCKPIYNIRTVIRSFLKVRQRYPRLQLILAGRGYGWEDFGIGHPEGIRVMDYAGQEKIAEVMALSDISISIPFSDSMANTLVESLAMNLYLVVSDLPAVREYLKNGIHASLVNPHDIEEVTAALALFFENPARCEAMKVQGRAICREFSEEKALQDIKQIYETVTSRCLVGRRA